MKYQSHIRLGCSTLKLRLRKNAVERTDLDRIQLWVHSGYICFNAMKMTIKYSRIILIKFELIRRLNSHCQYVPITCHCAPWSNPNSKKILFLTKLILWYIRDFVKELNSYISWSRSQNILKMSEKRTHDGEEIKMIREIKIENLLQDLLVSLVLDLFRTLASAIETCLINCVITVNMWSRYCYTTMLYLLCSLPWSSDIMPTMNYKIFKSVNWTLEMIPLKDYKIFWPNYTLSLNKTSLLKFIKQYV